MDPADRLSVRTDARNGVAHVSLDGELDMSTTPVLESYLAPFEADGLGTIMLDLRDLVFTDSTGIHAFEAAGKRVACSGKRLTLVGAKPVVRRVFDLTGTLDLLDDDDGADVAGRFARSDGHTEGQAPPTDDHG